ncbi:MAG TPA: hypothetical protein VE869_01755 [Gemmatimonas sp.]|nr:hypothetical protein [Gemmatimonas sp.]
MTTSINTVVRSVSRAVALAIVCATTIPAVSQAQSQSQPRLRGVARLGLEYGGEKVVQFEYEDGSTPDVTAGGGGLLTIGGVYRVLHVGPGAVEAQASVGLKYRTIPAATNQTATWLRFPVEALVFYRAPAGFRIGAGTTVHLANSLKASGDVANGRVNFGNTPGVVVQAEYLKNEWGFDLRYTALHYEVTNGSGTVGASNIGVGASYFFPRKR